MGGLKRVLEAREDLVPLWRRLRRAKTAEAQALVVYEASGLISDEGYGLIPESDLVGETRHHEIRRLRGFRACLTGLTAQEGT
jgi:hypothetical protein